ncbi:MAG: lysophospholipid acyltransferase family protein [Bacilli bacterium]
MPKDQKVLYVNNHNSNFDQMVMIQLLKDKKLCFITKPGNFGIPIAGSYMYWCGFLPINREDPRLAIPTIRKASNYVKEQITSVSICPEGTRNKTDQLMLPFHPGSFKIATSAKCPIVLISIRNTKNIKKNFPLHSTTVSFDVLTVLPFEQYQGLTTAELSEKCHKIIEDNLKKENAEE